MGQIKNNEVTPSESQVGAAQLACMAYYSDPAYKGSRLVNYGVYGATAAAAGQPTPAIMEEQEDALFYTQQAIALEMHQLQQWQRVKERQALSFHNEAAPINLLEHAAQAQTDTEMGLAAEKQQLMASMRNEAKKSSRLVQTEDEEANSDAIIPWHKVEASSAAGVDVRKPPPPDAAKASTGTSSSLGLDTNTKA